jgi:DNA primase
VAYYSDELIEEVISQNDIVEVVSEYVQLTKSGRNYMGLCPFHKEKSPSFCVSMDKQIYKCFGCGAGGNVIYFIMKNENMEFIEAVEFLATRAHIDLNKYITSSHANRVDNRDLKEIIYNINKDAAMYYHKNLVQKLEEDNNLIKEYIKKRNLDKNTIIKFGLGYGSGKIPLFTYLTEKGYTKEQIIASGIIIENDNGKLYDRFFSRLIFPIFDVRDRVIAFGGRVLDKSMPKYLNSAENIVYYKGKNLYALNFAKREKIDSVIIVEGYMDSVSLQKYGFTNVVASLGTALTVEQARLIKKFTDNVIIAYDQDAAGQDATMRGLDVLISKGLNVKVLKLDREDVKDPDEYVNKYGPERLKTCIANSMSLVEFKVSKIEKELDMNNIDSKIKFLNGAANILSKIDNNIERDLYIDKIASKYKIGKEPIVKEIDKKLKKDGVNIITNLNDVSRKIGSNINARKRVEQYIIALMILKDKEIQGKINENIDETTFKNSGIRNLYNYIISLSKEYDLNKIDILSKMKDEDLIKELTDVMYIDVSISGKEKLLGDVLNQIKKGKFTDRRMEILQRLGEDISKDEKDILQFELNQILIQMSKLK